MADAYLNIAERVLLTEQRPLRPREMIQRAYAGELLPWHLYGRRQDKTLHARLSEDIARSPERSRFYRTGPGVFYLNYLRDDPRTPESYREPYRATPRRKELNRDKVLGIKASDLTDNINVAAVAIKDLLNALRRGLYSYRGFSEFAEDAETAVIHSFVVLFKGHRVLSFRCGKFFPKSDPIYGRRSVGIGGAVLPDDLDILYNSMFGIVENGINELGYGVGLPQRLAERARYNNELGPYLAVFAEPSVPKVPRVLHVILGYRCPEEFEPSKAALSVNDLRWIDAHNPGNDLQDYDSTSRFLFLNRHLSQIVEGRAQA